MTHELLQPELLEHQPPRNHHSKPPAPRVPPVAGNVASSSMFPSLAQSACALCLAAMKAQSPGEQRLWARCLERRLADVVQKKTLNLPPFELSSSS
jgi:hypothetical protein